MKNCVYGQIWGALVPTIESVPVAYYDFMAGLTPTCMYHPYWVHGSKCYLVHIAHILALLWNQNRVWPSVGCCRSHKQGRPCGRLWFHGSLEPVLYIPAILGLWVQGLFGTCSSYTLCYEMKNRVYGQVRGVLVPTILGVPMADYDFMAAWALYCMYQPYWVRGSKGYLVHIAHIPALMWNQNRVYGLVWDDVLPTNEGVPVADYDLMAVWTLYCMHQPYWACGSKGYLVHKAHISPAAELKELYMAKFGVPSFPQSRAPLWQIMTLWQFGPQTVSTSHIRSVSPRVLCSYSSYACLTVESKSRI